MGIWQSAGTRKAIFENFRMRGGSHAALDLKEDGAVRTVTDSWVSICAHYADAVDSAVLTVGTAADGKSAAVFANVIAPTENAGATPSPRAGTRIVCKLITDESNTWRIVRIDL